MRRNSRDLFELISKLSPSEKRAISRAAAASGGARPSKYGILFDEIAAQSDHDEEALQRCAHENDIHDLPGSKRYLYNLILDQMSKKYWSETTAGKLRTMIAHAVTLFSRGLYTQARTILDKARGLARRAESFEALIQIEAIEINLQMHTGTPTLTPETVDESYKALFGAIDRLREGAELERLAGKMYVLEMKAGRIRDANIAQEADALMNSQVLQRSQYNKSPHSQLEWHDLHLRYYRLRSNAARTYYHSRAKVEVLEQHPTFADNNKHRSIFSYGHYLMECVKSGRWQEFERYRNQLLSFKRRYPDKRTTIDEIETYTTLWGAIHRANSHELSQAITSAATWLKENGDTLELSSTIGMLYGLAYGAIFLEDYRTALDWSGKMVHHPQLDQVGDVAVYARIINLLIHYELGDTDVLEHHLRSTFRFLHRRQRMYRIESALLHFIRQLPLVYNPELLRELFIDLRKTLRCLSSDPLESGALEYFAFDAWLTSKIEGRRFIDVWREERQEVWQNRQREELLNEA